MGKGRGGGKTPENVVKLINDALSETSLRALSKATGLGIAPLSRYSQGIGEPSTATLQKLGKYFGASVSWLRGDDGSDRFVHKIEYNEKLVRDCNVQNMTKFYKKLSLPEQENVAQMTGYFVALSLEQQQDLITSLVQHYFRVHGMPSNTAPMYDADGKAE